MWKAGRLENTTEQVEASMLQVWIPDFLSSTLNSGFLVQDLPASSLLTGLKLGRP